MLNRCWGHRAQPILSPLYRIGVRHEKLPDEERFLETIGKYISVDTERAEAFLKRLSDEQYNRLDVSLRLMDERNFSALEALDCYAFSTEEIIAFMDK